eukprot:8021148-Lingulodinium_polyedra.AAC.1
MPPTMLRLAPELSNQRLTGGGADNAANGTGSVCAKHPGGEGRAKVGACCPAEQHGNQKLALGNFRDDER